MNKSKASSKTGSKKDFDHDVHDKKVIGEEKIIDEYLKYQSDYEKIYGPNTIVLIEVGSFYEAYSTIKEGHNLEEFGSKMNLHCTRKNKSILEVSRSNPQMVGVPSHSIDDHIKKMVNSGYTVILYKQVAKINGSKKKCGRTFEAIYTPGTYTNSVARDSNYIASVYLIEQSGKGKTLLGGAITLIDLSTASNIVAEFYSLPNDNTLCLDEIQRMIKSYNPVEIIIHFTGSSYSKDFITSYFDGDHKIYFINTKSISPNDLNLFREEFLTIGYQNLTLGNVFDISKQLTLGKKLSAVEILNLETKPYSVVSYLIMLEYVRKHNDNLLKGLQYPEIYSSKKHLVLGNDAVGQLNVINNNGIDTYDSSINSLFDVVNKTTTILGKRYLKNALINPLSQTMKETIKYRYEMVEALINYEKQKKLYNALTKIKDIERYVRKMSMLNLSPLELMYLSNGMLGIIETMNILNSSKNVLLKNYFPKLNIASAILAFSDELLKLFNMEQCGKYLFKLIDGNIYNHGIHVDVDDYDKKINNVAEEIDEIRKYFNDKVRPPIKNLKNDPVKTSYTERDGHYLTVTKSKVNDIKKILSDKKSFTINVKGENIIVLSDDIEFKQQVSDAKIIIGSISERSTNKNNLQEEMRILIREYYIADLKRLYDKYSPMFYNVINAIGEIDFLLSGALVAMEYHYTKPIIESDDPIPSFVKFENLRHPIIEKINKETEYKPHTMELGNVPNAEVKQNGVLLFGLNSSGKTSHMKAIGLSVILAQIGYFVPATKFFYEPYMSIFARITGNDNMYKGLSSFDLEMTELQAIIARSENEDGPNTLIIGDEICRGTEIVSGIAVVAATIALLAKNMTSFIFATHLHEIPKLSIISELPNVKSWHLRVDFDEKNDCLVFERKLTPGSGPEVYGLMVAKYRIRNSDFTTIAESVKRDLIGEKQELASYQKTSYNSDLLKDLCEICGYQPIKKTDKDLDVHHINHQKDCNQRGQIIDKMHLHKNHLSNLVVLCKQCHKKVHADKIKIGGYLETSNGKKLDFTVI